MKRLMWVLCLGAALVIADAAVAQEHWTEGPVWSCTAIRTKEGHFDDYMTYLRTNFAPLNNELKKQGLILDWKTYVSTPAQPTDADVHLCVLYASYGKALDYSKGDDDTSKAISAAHYQTADEDKQDEMSKPRYEYRDILGTIYLREVALRPMP